MTWADHILSYYRNLKPPSVLPNGIEWLYPQQQPVVIDVVERFYRKYYKDSGTRTLLLGINPGRFGAGVTGVNFTAAKQLTECCNMEHPFKAQSELSAEFIYDMIAAYGGVEAFYQDFFIGSVCPLGFVQKGRNINYYDDKALLKTVEPFIIASLEKLLSYHTDRSRCICIGGEKNYKYLARLNASHNWFETIVSVPHPRFIMQYKRKEKASYILKYLDVLNKK